MSENLKNKLYVWAVFTVGGIIFGVFPEKKPINGYQQSFDELIVARKKDN